MKMLPLKSILSTLFLSLSLLFLSFSAFAYEAKMPVAVYCKSESTVTEYYFSYIKFLRSNNAQGSRLVIDEHDENRRGFPSMCIGDSSESTFIGGSDIYLTFQACGLRITITSLINSPDIINGVIKNAHDKVIDTVTCRFLPKGYKVSYESH